MPLIFLELRRLGGALERSDPAHGALDTVDAPYILYGVGAVMSPELDGAIIATHNRVRERLDQWADERTLLGFAEQQEGWRASFPAETAERLAEVKAAYDPDDVILSNHGAD